MQGGEHHGEPLILGSPVAAIPAATAMTATTASKERASRDETRPISWQAKFVHRAVLSEDGVVRECLRGLRRSSVLQEDLSVLHEERAVDEVLDVK